MFTIYEASLPSLVRALNNLKHVLSLGEAHVTAQNIAPEVFLAARLFPNMYPLTKQIQIATDMSKGAAARLAGIDVPSFEDNETSFAMLYARIDKTIRFINSVTSAQLNEAEERTIAFKAGSRDFSFSGSDYVTKWVLPNVYFHVTTAYNILRHNGVVLKKADFLGG